MKQVIRSYRHLFCSQKIVKPEQISFDFKIPHKNHKADHFQQKTPNNQQVKIVKAKRRDISKLLKPKSESDQYKLKVEELFDAQYKQTIEKNIKTSTYHNQQYLKGEHLLENIPLDPYYSYKIADFKRKMQIQKDKLKEFLGPIADHDQRAQLKQKMADAYHEKQQKYQLEQFAKYLDDYPGSPKGPMPEDDPQSYSKYAYRRIPQILLDQLAYNQSQKKKEVKESEASMLEGGAKIKIPVEQAFSDILGQKRSVNYDQWKDYQGDQIHDRTQGFAIYKEHQQIPQIPELPFRDYQAWMKDMANWRNFKNYYTQKHGYRQLCEYLDYMDKVHQENDPQPDNEWYRPKPAASSLYRYYKSLPKVLQDNRGLKDVYLGLEYYSPDMKNSDKEQMLNLAAKMSQPLEKVSQRAMADFIEKKKHYLTPFLVDKVFTMNPEFTWDIADFYAELKREQLKGQSMVKEEETSYPQPPQKHLDWEDNIGDIPVDYYDNDDGFWDGIISEKLKRYDEAQPMMKVRKYFTH